MSQDIMVIGDQSIIQQMRNRRGFFLIVIMVSCLIRLLSQKSQAYVTPLFF